MNAARSLYIEYAPVIDGAMSHVACTWIGETGDDGGYTDRVLPDACIDVIWNGQRLFVAGPDTGPVVGAQAPGTVLVGVRFRPGRAPDVLGVPANDILDQRVDVAQLWGDRTAARLRGDLDGRTPSDVRRTLERRVAAAASDADDGSVTTDGVLEMVANTDVDTLASELGVTPRTLHRRCVDGFGYGPKMLQRVLRFRRFLSLAEHDPDATVARLAATSGYADQSHLVRDCRQLAGLTPTDLLTSRNVRSVQDDDRYERSR